MITARVKRFVSAELYYYELDCLAADVEDLPTEGVANGSEAFAMDAAAVYKFDRENGVWLEVGAEESEEAADE